METLNSYLAYLSTDSLSVKVFVIIFATSILDFALKRVLHRIKEATHKTKNPWDEAIIWSLRKPLSLLIWVLGLSFAASLIYQETGSSIFAGVETIRDVAVIAIIAFFLTRMIKRGEVNLMNESIRKGKPYDRTTLDAIGKLLRLSVIITAGLMILQSLGFSISGVLAFGGIGGMAVGFAAKDLLANFFGGLTIYMDRPFSVGDWIRSPDREIEGTVENIGWRQTVIRTFEKRPLYIPNATFTTIAVENPSRMLNRRIKETVGIRYDDAGRMNRVIERVSEMLHSHEEIDTDQTIIANFNTFAPSSLDFFIYCYTRTTNWIEYHKVKQDVLLKVINIIEDEGAECAFPTSTLHLASMPDNETATIAADIGQSTPEPAR